MKKTINKELMEKGYIEMGLLNLEIADQYLYSEETGYEKGCEYIAI